MKVVFADTGDWVAVLDPQDKLHEKARRLMPSFRRGDVIKVQTRQTRRGGPRAFPAGCQMFGT
jgi:hypothetical protein